MRDPCTARRSNQSIPKGICPEYSLDGLMLKLKLQYFGQLMQRSHWKKLIDSLEKTLMLGKSEGRRKRERQRMRWLDGITNSVDISLSKLWKLVMDRTVWRASVHRVVNNRTRLSNRTELNCGLAVPHLGFPSGASGNEPACQCWRLEIRWFDVWVMKIPFKKA